MDNVGLASALWLGLALVASLISIWSVVSVALVEIITGAIAGNAVGLTLAPWVNFLAGLGAVMTIFLAGAEVDTQIVRKHPVESLSIGLLSFAVPFGAVLCFAHFVSAWPWDQAEIAGIALSTTSVAVIHAAMIESGLNKTELGRIILGACAITDLCTVLALGVVFAQYTKQVVYFAAFVGVVLLALPRLAPWFFRVMGRWVNEPETKFASLVLFFLGGIGGVMGTQAILPAYLIGMVLAPLFQREPELNHRLRIVAVTALTPFFFLKAGSLVDAHAILGGAELILILLFLKMGAKLLGILPLTALFGFGGRAGLYTASMMSTGLGFGSIAALFGLNNHIIDRNQYGIIVTAVIGTAIVPTLAAQYWFLPRHRPAR